MMLGINIAGALALVLSVAGTLPSLHAHASSLQQDVDAGHGRSLRFWRKFCKHKDAYGCGPLGEPACGKAAGNDCCTDGQFAPDGCQGDLICDDDNVCAPAPAPVPVSCGEAIGDNCCTDGQFAPDGCQGDLICDDGNVCAPAPAPAPVPCDTVRQGQVLGGADLGSFPAGDAHWCDKACKFQNNCGGWNFQTATGVCTLKAGTPTIINEDAGFVSKIAVLPPGVADEDQLAQHWSVELWRNRGYREQEEVADLRGVVVEAAQAAARANVLKDTTTAAYWG
eukprot:jgi/Ulvmu1/2964/UM015_0004.1